MATEPDMLHLYTQLAADGHGHTPDAGAPSDREELRSTVVEDVMAEARKDVFWAMMFAYATDEIPASDKNRLGIAWIDRTAITEQLMRAGMIPSHLKASGEGELADTWLVKNICRLRGTHPLFGQWAELNDERRVVLRYLPKLN